MKRLHLLGYIALTALLVLLAYNLLNKPLPSVQQSKTLIVITPNGPNTYYIKDEGEYAGFEYDLVNLFVKELGPEYSAKFVVTDHVGDVIPDLLNNKGHIAAANLSITNERQKKVAFGTPYQIAQQRLVFNKDNLNPPRSIMELSGKRIVVPSGTSYAQRLKALSKTIQNINWHEDKRANTEELLEQVNSGTLDYTVADSHLISILQNYYPNLAQGISIGDPEKIAWAFSKNVDPWLYQKSSAFFNKISQDGTLFHLVDRYYGHAKRLDTLDVTKFLSMTRSVLPKFAPLFKDAQENTDLDWRLLAAVSYQESHWDQYNTSPTNVRGLMMLTEETADHLGVTDRLDAKQSIMGGARYINQLKKQVPDSVPEPDRTWMALAAYNIGYSHVEDARILAKQLKKNPDRWADVKTTLPLLNRPEYYAKAKFGYASGGAPVIFVESIRTYNDILEKYAAPHTSIFPSFSFTK
jgi:membrane-bound lytic murein transglycosylase F